MDYLPIALQLRDRPVLVVGGGPVAARKVQLLRRAGARVTVWAPSVCDELARRIAAGEVEHRAGAYAGEPLDAWWLVVAATADAAVNDAVHRAAETARRPCNVVDRRELGSFIMPAIVDRSPVLVAVSTGGSSPTLARRLRAWLESLLPRRLGDVASFASAWRERARERLPDGAARRAFQEALIEGPVADHVLSGRREEAHAEAARRLDEIACGERPSGAGEVRIVGAGPGDAGLLTLHGLEALQWADVILHDRLVSHAVLELARRDARLESVGKVPGRGYERQSDINERMVALARQGKRVVRLKGGDSTLFARLGEELAALRDAGIPARVIPGVTAAAGCAAYTGMPLTDRDGAHAVVFVAAQGERNLDRQNWDSLASPNQTVVFYMGSSRAAYVCERLCAAGASPDLPVAVIGSGTTPQQTVRIGRLQELADLAAQVPAPTVLVVGEVAAQADVEKVLPPELQAPADHPWSDAAWTDILPRPIEQPATHPDARSD